jgi:CRP-like cAMP-binding protein
MTEIQKQLLAYVVNFDERSFDKISSYFKSKSVKKNTILLSNEDVCTEFYFVLNGCIRTYFLTKEGHEKTRYIMLAPSMGTALTSFISQKPSFEFIDALEDTELSFISHKDFFRLEKELPQWKEFYRNILEMAYSFQSRKIESLVTLSARQRYDQLMNENPFFIQRLSNKTIASYLDVTQETLSRLKSK